MRGNHIICNIVNLLWTGDIKGWILKKLSFQWDNLAGLKFATACIFLFVTWNIIILSMQKTEEEIVEGSTTQFPNVICQTSQTKPKWWKNIQDHEPKLNHYNQGNWGHWLWSSYKLLRRYRISFYSQMCKVKLSTFLFSSASAQTNLWGEGKLKPVEIGLVFAVRNTVIISCLCAGSPSHCWWSCLPLQRWPPCCCCSRTPGLQPGSCLSRQLVENLLHFHWLSHFLRKVKTALNVWIFNLRQGASSHLLNLSVQNDK